MSAPVLIAAKLMLPAVRPHAVARPRLLQRLDESQSRALTLVCAPPGYGKTTLISEWSAGRPGVGVLALDAADNVPARFCAYLLAALEQAVPGAVPGAAAAAVSHGEIDLAAFAAALVNDLVRLPRDATLILDDYHAISDESIHRLLAALLEHTPLRLHLVIAAQADPPFPLARLRAQGQLAELRWADLRFSAAETAAFLTESMGLKLPRSAVRELHERTEGWAAGLQLAGLSLQREREVEAVVAACAGSQTFIFDFLAEETFSRCAPNVQGFLLHTAVLERMCGPLCDAVTGEADGSAMLGRLERANLFVAPLGRDRCWYRYHQLFAEFLRGYLNARQPALIPELHRRAARWWEAQGDMAGAVGHWLAAREWQSAARAMELVGRDMLGRGEARTVTRWLEQLPPELIAVSPQLSLYRAWSLLLSGRAPALALQQLDALEQTLSSAHPLTPGAVAVVRGEMAAMRGSLAMLQGDTLQAIRLCREALAGIGDDPHLRALIALNLARGLWLAGDVSGAALVFADAALYAERSRRPLLAMGAAFYLGRLAMVQGRLTEAAERVRSALAQAERFGGAHIPAAAFGHVWLAEALLEMNDLDGALHHAEDGMEGARPVANLEAMVYATSVAVRVLAARGEVERAEALIEPAARGAMGGARAMLEATRAHLALVRGDVALLADWCRQARLDEPISPHRWFEQITLGRALFAAGREAEAERFLKRVVEASERSGCAGIALQALVPLAAVRQARGDMPGATALLRKARDLAAGEPYVRVFLDRGAVLGPTDAQSEPGLLSERELEVLRLMAGGLENQAIAERLVVTRGTAKWHIHNILAKLEATNRTEAVARARELHLL